MVTQINDKKVIYLMSGGEFNVAVDSDNQLWVWGRNEFGQVRFCLDLFFFFILL